MRSTLLRFFVVVGWMLAGCHRGPSLNVSSVNELVPQEYKHELVFEPGDAMHGPIKFILPVPKGWAADSVFGEGSGLGIYTNGSSSISVHTSCDHKGICIPANWNKEIDKDLTWLNDIARTKPTGWGMDRSDSDIVKVERDVWMHNRRIVRTRDVLGEDHGDPGISVKVFWWNVGSSEYFTCGAHLTSGLQKAADAFEKACLLAEVVY